MHYRILTDASGSSLTVSPEEGALHIELFEETLALVNGAFERCGVPLKPVATGRTPEVLSDSTMRRLVALEDALQDCRNVLADYADGVVNDEVVETVLAKADELLGLEDDE
jgi:hypothetical protein